MCVCVDRLWRQGMCVCVCDCVLLMDAACICLYFLLCISFQSTRFVVAIHTLRVKESSVSMPHHHHLSAETPSENARTEKKKREREKCPNYWRIYGDGVFLFALLYRTFFGDICLEYLRADCGVQVQPQKTIIIRNNIFIKKRRF